MGEPGEPRAAVAIGQSYEASLSDVARRAGAHYTPPDVARGLVEVALDHWEGRGRPRIEDPTCGGGAFLVAAADALVARGVEPSDALACLSGVDIDSGAVGAANAAMASWADEHGCAPRAVATIGDAMGVDPASTVDIVVGNPPFGSQLRRRTARSASARAAVGDELGAAGRGYVDDAVVHALVAVRRLRPGGVLCLVLPRSTAAARGASAARRELAGHGLVACWDPGERVFAAGVEVIAPVIRMGAAPRPVSLYTGAVARATSHRVPVGSSGSSWSPLLATIAGVPAPPVAGHGRTVADVASCVGDFRQHYYALVGHVAEEHPPTGPRLVTSGAVGFGEITWGRRPVRFARTAYSRPRVDVGAVRAEHPELAAWLDARLQPKVLVAPQGSRLRAAVDPIGDVVPVTPLITCVPTAVSLWHLLAVLLSPAASAWCVHQGAGSGLSRDAIRPTAAMVAGIPLPGGLDAWDDAAAMLERPAPELSEVGRRMDDAYGASGTGWYEWWSAALG